MVTTLIQKEHSSIALLQNNVPPEGYYLAFSGGKDSVVIYNLAMKAGVKFDAHYNVTTIDPPELLRFIKNKYPLVIWDRPIMTMWDLVRKKGLPIRTKRFCCEYLKEHGGEGRITIIGIRKTESTTRKKFGADVKTHLKKTLVSPILDWTDEDV